VGVFTWRLVTTTESNPPGPEDDQAVIVVASWRYLGCGYQSTGEAWLAASAAARAREARRITKEELRTIRAA
jgi:hypothetical protein